MSRWRPVGLSGGLALCLVTGFCAVPPGAGARGASHGPAVMVVQTTNSLSQRLMRLSSLEFSTSAPHGVPIIKVTDSVHYQRFVGVGGAMTDTSAWLIHDQLPRTRRRVLMHALFGADGINLSFIRVPIGASDFTVNGRPYSYDDLAPGRSDASLSGFSIAHDQPYILPALRGALALDPSAEIIATPWSPPSWMKTNDAPDNAGDSATLRPAAFGSLARYFVKFLRTYARAGVPVAAITPQNEPGQATSYPGMSMSARAEARLVARYLEPALRRAGLGATRIYGFDYGWTASLPPYVSALLSSQAGKSLAGIAFHCYGGDPTVMGRLERIAPTLTELVTECSPGRDAAWFPGELEIAALRNWANGVNLWNLALDPAGGPVEPPNSGCRGCTGIVTIDPRTHRFSLGLTYFQLGQVSKFVRPGAVRISTNHFVRYSAGRRVTPGLDDVAFLNPDGSKVLVAYNNSSSAIGFGVRWDGRFLSYSLPPRAMVTLTW